MELYVYGYTRQLIGVVESFEYLRWTRRYSQCGAFELKAIATSDNIALLTLGNFLWKSDDEEIGIIEHLEMNQADKEAIIDTNIDNSEAENKIEQLKLFADSHPDLYKEFLQNITVDDFKTIEG